MRFKIEELVPIVGKLAEHYTAGQSTSITYEKAEQLMEAVLYCIQEMEQVRPDSLISEKDLTAQSAYEIGLACVEEKTKKALQLYNELLPQFCDYGNICLRDTFMKGLPEFFKWYDIRFEPQNTILTLDYPVLKDISSYTGIDKIYEFIQCVHAEQKLLKRFPKNYVITVLASYDGQYKEMVENICEIVMTSAIKGVLKRKPDTGLEEFIEEVRGCASKHAEFERIKEYKHEYASKQTNIRRTI